MTTIYKKPEWFFYPAWIILTVLCFPIAFFISMLILKIMISVIGDTIYVDGVRHITEDYLFRYVFVPIVGLLIGVLQYGLLRRYLPRMGGWILATIGGWLLGVFLILISEWLNGKGLSANLDFGLLMIGFSTGLGQWLLLRRRLPYAGWWIGASILGWGLVGLITTGNSLGQFGFLAVGFLPACVTAIALVLLINQDDQPELKDA